MAKTKPGAESDEMAIPLPVPPRRTFAIGGRLIGPTIVGGVVTQDDPCVGHDRAGSRRHHRN